MRDYLGNALLAPSPGRKEFDPETELGISTVFPRLDYGFTGAERPPGEALVLVDSAGCRTLAASGPCVPSSVSWQMASGASSRPRGQGAMTRGAWHGGPVSPR